MVLHIACDAHRITSGVVDSTADLLGIFTDDGEASIDLTETLVTESVGTGKVRCDIAVWRGEVGQDRLGQAGIALVGELNGLGTIRVALEQSDGVGDNRVRNEVLIKLRSSVSQWRNANKNTTLGGRIHLHTSKN